MNKSPASKYVRVLAVAAAAAILAVGAGCGSKNKQARAPKLDEGEQNRLLIRMALAENVYNATATERAVYPKDFNPGTATLNALGNRRVETLLHACRGAKGRVTIIRGEEPDEVYTQRVGAVRQQFVDAGINVEHINVVKGDHVEGGGISSGQASLIFDRMLSDYAPKPQQGGAAANAAGTQGNVSTGTNSR